MQSSCLMFPRELALRIPFDPTLKFHQDVGWLVDVAHSTANILVFQTTEPLCIYNVKLGAGSVSQEINSDASISRAVDRLSVDGKRVLGDFILTQSLISSRRAGSIRGIVRVTRAGVTLGRPGLPALGYAAVSAIKVVASKFWP